jgi:hypothetical protein
MRMALRLVTVLVAISLMSSLPVHGEPCEGVAAPCRSAQSQPLNCCSPAHCHCDLSGPVQPAPNPTPVRATTGHEIVKVASLPVDAMFLADGEYLSLRSTARADTSLPSATGSYLLTHAFLI